jgi:hypothetical protein
MNIHTVVENLTNTIRNKETYLAGLCENIRAYESRDDLGDGWMVARTMADFLEININELKVILHDCEQCAQQYSLMTWEINPERMGQ